MAGKCLGVGTTRNFHPVFINREKGLGGGFFSSPGQYKAGKLMSTTFLTFFFLPFFPSLCPFSGFNWNLK